MLKIDKKYHKPFLWLAIIGIATFGLAYLRDKRALALLALNYGADPANPNYVFFNGKVNGCDVKFFYDSGASSSTINQADTAKCLAGTKPAGTKKIATNAGVVDQKYYNVSLQLPDGAAFDTIIVSDNGLYSAIAPKDLTTIYDISQTSVGVTLTPKGSTTPTAIISPTPTPAKKKKSGGKSKNSGCPSGQKMIGGICHSKGFKPSGGDIQKSLCAKSGMVASGNGCASVSDLCAGLTGATLTACKQAHSASSNIPKSGISIPLSYS